MKPEELVQLAEKAMENAYAPYSGFRVGAALECADGTVFTGCNIENGSYSATVCAERVAVFNAVSNGKREFTAIAVCGGRDGIVTGLCPPCGVCLQVLGEFCSGDMKLYLGKPGGYEERTLDQLLPEGFRLEG